MRAVVTLAESYRGPAPGPRRRVHAEIGHLAARLAAGQVESHVLTYAVATELLLDSGSTPRLSPGGKRLLA